MCDGKQQHDEHEILDLIVVGGGVNGAGIAADAAGRGLSVGLYDAADFASATSSASSKLIHGGLRYLEHYEFRLVAESLAEREVLLRSAPHIVKPMRFCLPHRPFLRPAWMIRAGLFLYDHLGKRTTLAGSKQVCLVGKQGLQPAFRKGFEYSDCWVDDARLVLINALSAQANGAEIENYCQVETAQRENGIWHLCLYNSLTKQRLQRRSRALVNATGPWVKQFFDDNLQLPSPRNIRLVKGSHIVVPRIHDEDLAYILQNEDQRVVFVIPYLDDFSIVGTTDLEYQADPREVTISDEEVSYLIDVVNQHFVNTLTVADVVSTYSGVRPLCDDESSSPQAITRDYTLELQQSEGQAPLLSVFGGKLTTYRKLAEAAMAMLQPYFPDSGENWTAAAVLPGGDFNCSRAKLLDAILQQYPWLDAKLGKRYVDQYGTMTTTLLADSCNERALGIDFGHGLYSREVNYLMAHEFAKNCQDVLWRRTKLGLYLSPAQQSLLTDYISSRAQTHSVKNVS